MESLVRVLKEEKKVLLRWGDNEKRGANPSLMKEVATDLDKKIREIEKKEKEVTEETVEALEELREQLLLFYENEEALRAYPLNDRANYLAALASKIRLKKLI